jgi:hypothetical protein
VEEIPPFFIGIRSGNDIKKSPISNPEIGDFLLYKLKDSINFEVFILSS